jgi:hypothetical protein
VQKATWLAYEYHYDAKVLPDDLQDLEVETVVLPVEQICRNSFSWMVQQEVLSHCFVVVHDLANVLRSQTNPLGLRLPLVPSLFSPSFRHSSSDPVCQHFLVGHYTHQKGHGVPTREARGDVK